jgi:hypothetical protein
MELLFDHETGELIIKQADQAVHPDAVVMDQPTEYGWAAGDAVSPVVYLEPQHLNRFVRCVGPLWGLGYESVRRRVYDAPASLPDDDLDSARFLPCEFQPCSVEDLPILTADRVCALRADQDGLTIPRGRVLRLYFAKVLGEYQWRGFLTRGTHAVEIRVTAPEPERMTWQFQETLRRVGHNLYGSTLQRVRR